MSMSNNEVVAEFIVESQEHLADIENQLLAIEAGGAAIDLELVNTVFRSIHSIKGASGFLGFTAIGELSHSMENVLNLMRGKELVPTSETIDVLLKAADVLRGMINVAEQSNGTDVSAHVTALKRIIEGGTTPAVQTSMKQTTEIPGPGGIVLRVTEHVLATQRTIGHRLYLVSIDLISEVEAKGMTPLAWVKGLLSFAELLDSRLDLVDGGGLDSELPGAMRFVALIGTVLEDPEIVATACKVPVTQVQPAHIDQAAPAPATAPHPPATVGPDATRTAAADTAATPVSPASAPVEPADAAAAPPIHEEVPSPVHQEPAAAAPTASMSGSTTGPGTAATSAGGTETSIRVSVGLLDHLMNLAGELVLGRNQLLQMIATKDQSGLESVGGRLNQVTSELQEAIMQTRMQPIGSVFSKFPRVVRDLSSKLGKQCELVVEGKDVELDKSIIEAIGDPLTHLIRNSVDHGIERPGTRTAKGKKASGTVVLRAFHQAGKVNITITDDGTGIDAEKLKAKAIEKGLITTSAAREMSERDAIRLIFHPGFSMAEKVTDVSGRGVGMDVVKTNIQKAGGTVDVETQVGAGTTISIKLPLTLAIIPSLIVRCGEERYAIPQVNISELVRIKATEAASKIERVSGAEVLRLRGNLLPLVRLSKALEIQSKRLDPLPATLEDNLRENLADRRSGRAAPPEIEEHRSGADRRTDTAAGALNIIVVETGHLRYGMIVDGLHDSEEIVVKPLGSHLKGTPCLAGATILGDGRVALILDIAGIASHCQLAVPETEDDAEATEQGASGSGETHTLLLFTNEPSEQFGVPMGLIARIERIRTSQIDSVGGQDILQYRGSSLPLLSLDQHIKAKPRAQQDTVYVVVFRAAKQEIGLIAPNLVDIREVDAEVDTITFHQPGVMGSMVIDGKATRLVDLFELARTAHPDWFTGQTASDQGLKIKPRLLLAEDSAFFRNQLNGFLTDEGFEVVACEDGQVAWDKLQSADEPFSAVVTDIEMPNMDGYNLTHHIKQSPLYSHLPVIAVTSLGGQEDMRRGKEVGVDEYQVKLDRDQLIAAVRRLLKATNPTRGPSQETTPSQTRRSR